jgi:hypothetical protein
MIHWEKCYLFYLLVCRLFNDSIRNLRLIASDDCMIHEWFRKDIWRSGCGPNSGIVTEFLGETEGTMKISIRIVGAPAEIRNEYLPNTRTSQKRFQLKQTAQLATVLEGTVWTFRIYCGILARESMRFFSQNSRSRCESKPGAYRLRVTYITAVANCWMWRWRRY